MDCILVYNSKDVLVTEWLESHNVQIDRQPSITGTVWNRSDTYKAIVPISVLIDRIKEYCSFIEIFKRAIRSTKYTINYPIFRNDMVYGNTVYSFNKNVLSWHGNICIEKNKMDIEPSSKYNTPLADLEQEMIERINALRHIERSNKVEYVDISTHFITEEIKSAIASIANGTDPVISGFVFDDDNRVIYLSYEPMAGAVKNLVKCDICNEWVHAESMQTHKFDSQCILNRDWYVIDNNKSLAPIEDDELRRLALSGKFGPAHIKYASITDVYIDNRIVELTNLWKEAIAKEKDAVTSLEDFIMASIGASR